MSSQKTPRYGLHKWEPADDFLREEFNENFQFLEERVLHLEFGKYMGDASAEQFIDLGFVPKAVYVYREDGQTGSVYSTNSYRYGGLATADMPLVVNSATMLKLEGTGFWVYYNIGKDIFANGKGVEYRYCVFC